MFGPGEMCRFRWGLAGDYPREMSRLRQLLEEYAHRATEDGRRSGGRDGLQTTRARPFTTVDVVLPSTPRSRPNRNVNTTLCRYPRSTPLLAKQAQIGAGGITNTALLDYWEARSQLEQFARWHVPEPRGAAGNGVARHERKATGPGEWQHAGRGVLEEHVATQTRSINAYNRWSVLTRKRNMLNT